MPVVGVMTPFGDTVVPAVRLAEPADIDSINANRAEQSVAFLHFTSPA